MHRRRLIITRHRRRALSYLFRQFASAWSWVQRLVVIMVRDSTVAAGSTAATLTGADIIVTGTDQRRVCIEAAVSAGTKVNAMVPVLMGRLFRFCFDFRKSRFLQLLIQRGKIGLE